MLYEPAKNPYSAEVHPMPPSAIGVFRVVDSGDTMSQKTYPIIMMKDAMKRIIQRVLRDSFSIFFSL